MVRIGRRFVTRPKTVLGRFFPRHASAQVRTALSDTRIVAVVGPRQSSRTTLVQRIARNANLPCETLNDVLPRRFGVDAPIGFDRAFPAAAIDELRHAPELILAPAAEWMKTGVRDTSVGTALAIPSSESRPVALPRMPAPDTSLIRPLYSTLVRPVSAFKLARAMPRTERGSGSDATSFRTGRPFSLDQTDSLSELAYLVFQIGRNYNPYWTSICDQV